MLKISKGSACSFVVLAATLGLTACPTSLQKPTRARLTQEEIDSGRLDVYELMRRGRELTLHQFGLDDGYGNGRDGATPPNFSRLVGPDSTSCNSCHGLGGIVMGWGTNASNVLVAIDDPVEPTVAGSNERQPTMVQGSVWLELLSKEMSLELRALRDEAVAAARGSGTATKVTLTTKSVSFGSITAFPDGSVDNSTLEGCDPDLRVRPFHRKGMASTMRIFARGALARHFGIQSYDELLRLNENRDPSAWDEDEDGVIDEFNEAELTALTLYCVSLPAPVETETGSQDVEAGRALMEHFDCTMCHKPFLELDDPTFRDMSSTGSLIEIDLLDPFLGAPRLTALPDGGVRVQAWTDLKRHDIGPESHEPLDQPQDDTLPNWDGGSRGERISEVLPDIPKELMLTTTLWGVGDTAPYFHDGSSPTIEDAILRHGGESQTARDKYASATAEERDQLLTFLHQLRVGLVGEVMPQ